MEKLLEDYFVLDCTVEDLTNAFDAICAFMFSDSDSPKYTLQDLIEMMEGRLTSNIEKERNRATSLLAELLHVNKISLKPPVIHLFAVFFSKRLSDYPSVSPSLHALTALVRHYGNQFEPKYFDAIDIIQAVGKDVNVPKYPQNIRQQAFILYDELLSNALLVQSLQSIGVEVIEGILRNMEQEKDPRCLLLALHVIGKACKQFSSCIVGGSAGSIAEQIFDATSCYFPITFVPPPDDPFGITPEQLVLALESVLCYHSAIIPYTTQFLVSQLTSELSVARVHSMRTLCLMVGKHTHSILQGDQQYSNGAVHDSLLAAASEQLYDLATDDTSSEYIKGALETIGAITASISRDLSVKYLADWRAFNEPLLRRVVGEVQGNLGGLQAKMALSVALTMARCNCVSCGVVMKLLLPVIAGKAATTCGVMHTALKRALQAERKGFSVLPSLTANDAVLSTPVEMLFQLITCCTSVTSGTDKVDMSHMKELDPLRAHCSLLFDVLYEHFQVSDITEGGATEESEGSASGSAVVSMERLIQFQPTLDIVTLFIECTRTMRQLLSKVSPADLDGDKLSRFIHLLTGLSLYGVSYLWLHTAYDDKHPDVMSVVNSRSHTFRLPTEDPLKVCFLTVLVSLAGNFEYSGILERHCTEPLLALCKHEAVVGGPITGGIYAIFSAMSRESQGSALLSCFAPMLFGSIQSALEEYRSSNSAGALKVAGQTFTTMRDLLQAEPSSATAASTGSMAAHTHTHDGKVCTSDHSHDGEHGSNSSSSSSSTDSLSLSAGSSSGVVTDSGIKAAFLIAPLADQETGVNPVIEAVLGVFRLFDGSSTDFDNVIEPVLGLIRRLVLSLDTVQQTSFIHSLLSALMAESQNVQKSVLFVSLACNCLVYQEKSSALFTNHTAASTASDKDVIAAAVSVALQCVSSVGSSGASWRQFGSPQLVAIVVNKLPNGPLLQSILRQVLGLVEVHSMAETADVASAAASLFVWALKGVLSRPVLPTDATIEGKTNWQEVLQTKLSEALVSSSSSSSSSSSRSKSSHFCSAVATELSALVQDHGHILSAASRGNTALFWKQKLWSALHASLLSDANAFISQQKSKTVSSGGGGAAAMEVTSSSSTSNCSSVSLLALCTLTVGLPINIIQSQFKELVDITVYAVSFTSSGDGDASSFNSGDASLSQLQVQSLKSLEILLKYDAMEFVSYLNVIIPVLLKVSQTAYAARQRGAAIESLLAIYMQMPYPRVHPYKAAVVKGLVPALDDKKRVVRQLAGKVRNKWMMPKE